MPAVARVALATCCLLGGGGAALAGRAQVLTADTSARSVSAGVYTAAQARGGEALFRRVCTDCHATAQFADSSFRRTWEGRTARELFELVRTQMPQDAPGTLRRDEYLAALAYLLQLAGYPPGDSALSSDTAALRRVRFDSNRTPP